MTISTNCSAEIQQAKVNGAPFKVAFARRRLQENIVSLLQYRPGAALDAYWMAQDTFWPSHEDVADALEHLSVTGAIDVVMINNSDRLATTYRLSPVVAQ